MLYEAFGSIYLYLFYLGLMLLPIGFIFWLFSYSNVSKEVKLFYFIAATIFLLSFFILKGYSSIVYFNMVFSDIPSYKVKGLIIKVEEGHSNKKIYLSNGEMFSYHMLDNLCSNKEWYKIFSEGLVVEISYVKIFFDKKCAFQIKQIMVKK